MSEDVVSDTLESLSAFGSDVGSNSIGKRIDRHAEDYAEDYAECEDEVESSGQNPSRWARSGSMYWGVQDSTAALPVGMYTGSWSQGVGYYLDKKANLTDGLIHLPDSASDSVIDEINRFAELKSEFLARNLVYKRGIFLWGPPGSGKTSTVSQIVDIIINKMGGIAFMVEDPNVAGECLKLIRRIEPERQIVAIFEDMDALIERYGEAKYLSILDGENQVDNIVFVATTNYPEKIDKRFINRPSRFDTVIKVGMPSDAARAIYLANKEPSLTQVEIDKYVSLSKGFSLAHMREFIVSTRVFKCDVDWAAKKLRAMMEVNLSSTQDEDRSFGFTSSRSEPKVASIHAMPKTAEGNAGVVGKSTTTHYRDGTSITVGSASERLPGMGYIGRGISKF